MSKPKRKRTINEQIDSHDEPVFAAEQLPVVPSAQARSTRVPFDEPVFDAVPAQARGVTLPVDAPRGQLGWDPSTADETAKPGNPAEPLLARRLGRSVSGWVWLAAAVVIVLLLVIRFLPRTPTSEEPLLVTLPAAGVVGSALLGDSETPAATPEPTIPPTSAPPAVRLTPGMQVVVYNTNGQGIRLRASPGTNQLTLGIYNDGAPFTVLTPGGDYSDYPVEVDGYFWYRIRVQEDPTSQLVGWAVGDFLAISEQ